MLVCGGLGYIGSVVSHTLVREGEHVVIIDNMSRGHMQALPKGVSNNDNEYSPSIPYDVALMFKK